MLDDAADVVQRHVRQVGVARTGEHRLAVLPDRLVAVHARTVVTEHRLRHERCGLAIGGRDVVHDILELLHVVGGLDERGELDAQLMLRSGHFVVVLLDLDAHLAQHGQHLGAQILSRVDRGNREVAALDGRAVTQITVG